MRWIFRILGVLVLLVLLGIVGIFLIPSERIATIAETRFEEATGRKLSIAGDVSPQVFPRLGVALEDVSIANAGWAGTDPLLEADRLELGVGLTALIGGDIVVEAARIEAPIIRLQKNAQGEANWDFLTDLGGGDSSGGAAPEISLPLAEITGGRLEFRDASTGADSTLSEVNAAVQMAQLSGPATVDISAILNGQTITAEARIAHVKSLLDGGLEGIAASAQIGGNNLSYDGNLKLEPIQAKGSIAADLSDLKAVFDLAGLSMPIIPPGLGQHPKLSAELTMTDANTLFLRQTVLDLDQNRLMGDLDIVLGEVPTVNARLAAGSLDFSAMSTDTTEGDGAANVGSGGWSDARIDVSGLSAVNGEFLLDLGAADFGSVQISDAQIKASLDRSRLVLDLSRVGAFDGIVSGQFVVNGRGGLSVGGDLVAREVAMQRVLEDFAGYDRLIGDAGMSLKFLGSGDTMDQIMKGLSGSGRVDIGTGEILGLDIAGMIRNLDSSFRGEGQSTVFDSITASYVIEGGVLRNDDLSLQARLATATGRGSLDIGGQTIDYRVEPVALAEQLGDGITVPVMITGPWSDMKFRPDLKAIADQALQAEREELEAAARAKEQELKDRAAAKIEQELGVAREEGQGLEDQLKQGLEDRAKDRLKGLFGLGQDPEPAATE